MKKQTGATLLVAGTCIGSGMISLPMVLSQIGLVPSVLMMLAMWAIIYYTALISLELNLQAGKAMSLGDLGNYFSGKKAGLIGSSSFQILSFALISVYLYAGSSVIQKMLSFHYNAEFNFINIVSVYAIITAILFIFPIKLVDYVNRFLFISLILVISILVGGMIFKINWQNLPLFSHEYKTMSPWIIIAPVLFTAFGFHGSLPTLIEYCDNNKKILKKVFLWGCCIPSLVYIIWTFSVLSVIYNDNPAVYSKMIEGSLDVGDLIKELSLIVNSKYVQTLVWWISLLAIITSLLGVGISLCKTISIFISSKTNTSNKSSNIISSLITVTPSYLMAILVPNAFIKILGFAGMILVVIAILLPIYLLKRIDNINLKCKELKDDLILALGAIGIIIIVSEILNIYQNSCLVTT